MGQNGPVQVQTVPLSDPRVVPLLSGLGREYDERYGPSDVMADAHPEQFEAPEGAFLLLIQDGVTVAGGGYRRVDAGTCEIKRMWTAPEHRRRGHARTVLTALQERARRAGYSCIRLETGPMQPEAVALYEGLGYRRIPPYGRYQEAWAFERALP